MLAFDASTTRPQRPTFVMTMGLLTWLVVVPGCGHLMVGNVSSNGCEASLVNSVDPAGCEVADGFAFNRFRDAGTKLQLSNQSAAEKLAVCSARLQDSWQRSPIEQWKAERREKLTAPPFPRFHPLPTNPVFFPEDGMSASIGSEGRP